MKYKITIEKIEETSYTQSDGTPRTSTITDEIYTQTTEDEIDIKSIIDAFNKQPFKAGGGGGGFDPDKQLV